MKKFPDNNCKNLKTRFSLLLVFYRIWNLFPVAVNPRLKSLLEVYSWIWTSITVIFLIRTLQLATHTSVFLQKSISGYITFIMLGYTIGTNTFVNVKLFYTRHMHAKIYTTIKEIDQIFEKKLLIKFDYENEDQDLLKRTAISSIFIVICITAYVVSCFFTKQSAEITCYCLFPGICNRFFCIMYGNFIKLVRNRLRIIKSVLIKNIVYEKVQKESKNQEDKLDALKMAYGKLWQITIELEEALGFCLFIITILLCCIITVNLYWLLLYVMGFKSQVYLTPFGKFLNISYLNRLFHYYLSQQKIQLLSYQVFI